MLLARWLHSWTRAVLLLEALKVICTSSPGTKVYGSCLERLQVCCLTSPSPNDGQQLCTLMLILQLAPNGFASHDSIWQCRAASAGPQSCTAQEGVICRLQQKARYVQAAEWLPSSKGLLVSHWHELYRSCFCMHGNL